MTLAKKLTIETLPLEDAIIVLCAFGKPLLHLTDKGWHCAVDMHVSTKGASFTVRSDFNCQTPTIAVRQCAERINATLNS